MVVHCIKCGVIGLTSQKRADLDYEFEGFQWWMQFGIDKGILSQHKRAKGHYYKQDKIKYKNYPLVIPKNQASFRTRKTQLTPFWIKISVRKRKGIGIWLPIKPHKPLHDIRYLKDSLLIKNHRGNYELRLIFDVPQRKIIPRNILAIDLGEKHIATVCDSKGNEAFLGRDIRGLRSHFNWLRRRLGKKKLLKKIKAMAQKEKNKIANKLHLISKAIVQWAKRTKSIIVLGDLKGIMKNVKGKRMRRFISSMPFYKLTAMIRYKARQQGIQVFKMKEHYTSLLYHKCGALGKRDKTSFSCNCCGMQYHADLNGAANILNRAKRQDFLARAVAVARKSITELTSTGKPTV